MSRSILYVTTFNRKLWDASGRAMVQSFFDTNTWGDLMIGWEGDRSLYDEVSELINLMQVKYTQRTTQETFLVNVGASQLLKEWTETNKDIIPPEYGGECTTWGNECKEKWGTNFNRQAARWFRKFVVLDSAREHIEYNMIVFVDCDTIFVKELPDDLIEDALEDMDMFYHCGDNRRRRDTGMESGFMGWKRDDLTLTYHVLDAAIDMYMDGSYRDLKRWDDSYVLRHLCETGLYRTRDVVKPHIEQAGAHVIIHGPFAPYVQHDKGKHQRAGLVVKNQ